MFALTFMHPHTMPVFHAAAEGMAEIRADDGDKATEALLIRLIEETGGAVGDENAADAFPLTIALADELHQLTDDLIQNCLDDSSGVGEDDDQEIYIFTGDVIIARFVEGGKAP
jgi:hypothetical protein